MNPKSPDIVPTPQQLTLQQHAGSSGESRSILCGKRMYLDGQRNVREKQREAEKCKRKNKERQVAISSALSLSLKKRNTNSTISTKKFAKLNYDTQRRNSKNEYTV